MTKSHITNFAIVLAALLAALAPIPISGNLQINAAENALAQNDYKTAAEAYQQAARLLFWRRELWERSGIAFAEDRNYAQAKTNLENAPELTAEGWVWLGFSRRKLGDTSGAIAAYQQAAKLTDSPALYETLAIFHRSQKDWHNERTALENQIRVDENNAYAHYRLGILLIYFDDFPKADSSLRRASFLDSQFDPVSDSLRATLTFAARQGDISQRDVTLGRALGLVQEWQIALEMFLKAVEINADNAEAQAWLAEAKQQNGQDGRVELDRALALGNQSAVVRGLRGLYFNRQGNYQEALNEYLLADEYEPENPAWKAEIGGAYFHLGDLALAMDYYQQAVALAPNDPAYWRLLAVFCAENGVQVEEIGLPAALNAVTLDPNDTANLDALGFSYFSSGRYASAEQSLNEALKLDAGYFPARIHLAVNYLAQGNRAAAYNELTFIRDADEEGAHREIALQLLARYFP